MTPADRTVRAPTAHRAISAVTAPLLGLLIARLLLRFTPAPTLLTYAVCLAIGLLLAVRAWRVRVDGSGGSDASGGGLRVHNLLASTTVPAGTVRRVSDLGRVEWRRGDHRALRLPSEALRGPWWTFGSGADTYARNREQVRSWLRAARSDADRRDGAP
ncbi:MAG: hypothetical protein ABIS35_00025 [Terracoccus sp.]